MVRILVIEFTLHSPSVVSLLPLLILVVTGVVVISIAFGTSRRQRGTRQTFIAVLIIGVVIVGLGIGLAYSGTSPSTVTVGNGYVYIQTSSFGGIGKKNITSTEIAGAYVGQIGSGNLTISKQHGTNIGNYNVGVFTLGSGATAYVVSDNSTVLVIELSSGKYVLLGTPNTNALISDFAQYVYPVKS